MANATSTLVCIKPGEGLVSRTDVFECLSDDDYRGACFALMAVLENVETELTRRVKQLEALPATARG